MKATPRTRKVSESVKEALASILQGDVSDPRLALVTVTSVEVSTDLRHAVVYVTAHGGPEAYDRALEGLASASGRMRAALGRRVRMKYTPELHFRIDESVDVGERIGQVLRQVPPSLSAASDDAPEAEENGDRGATGEPGGEAALEEDTLS